jgi:hypothetical protein
MEKSTSSRSTSRRRMPNGALLRKVNQQMDRVGLDEIPPAVSRYVERNWQTIAIATATAAVIGVAGYFVLREYGYFESRGRN